MLDEDAPILLAFSRHERWLMWCGYCQGWHVHRELGYQEARCASPDSEYRLTGYVLVDGGPLTYDRRVRRERPARL
jgi:hypothetical protein